MTSGTAVGLGLAAASTTLTNLAYLREHDAAASLPCLSMRRPLHSLKLLLTSRGWLVGFAMESGGFALYAAALALASLAVVQSIGAGGIAILGFVSARMSGRPLDRRHIVAITLAVVGLVALAVSLVQGSGQGGEGSIVEVALWLGASAAVACLVLAVGRRTRHEAIADGIAGGLFFSIGDISTKLATQGGARFGFVVTLVIGYTLGTSLLQLGYQRGGALTVAGLATLLTNALPIAAGTTVLHEPVPSGVLGGVRIFAFAAVIASAILLAAPERPARQRSADPAPVAA